jgi:hypothetical protein
MLPLKTSGGTFQISIWKILISVVSFKEGTWEAAMRHVCALLYTPFEFCIMYFYPVFEK